MLNELKNEITIKEAHYLNWATSTHNIMLSLDVEDALATTSSLDVFKLASLICDNYPDGIRRDNFSTKLKNNFTHSRNFNWCLHHLGNASVDQPPIHKAILAHITRRTDPVVLPYTLLSDLSTALPSHIFTTYLSYLTDVGTVQQLTDVLQLTEYGDSWDCRDNVTAKLEDNGSLEALKGLLWFSVGSNATKYYNKLVAMNTVESLLILTYHTRDFDSLVEVEKIMSLINTKYSTN